MIQMRLVLLTVIVCAGAVAAHPQQPIPSPATPGATPQESCGKAPSLEGTTWDGVIDYYSNKEKEVYEFRKGGELVQTTSNGRFDGHVWKQDGTCVYMNFNQGYVEFRGKAVHDRMEGTFKARGGMEWTLKAERRGMTGGGAAEFENLRKEYKRHYSVGDFREAAKVAVRAVKAAEKEFGPTSTNLIEALNELALIYQMDGQYRTALPVAERAAAISEQARGRQSKEYANALNTLGKSYTGLEKYVEAEDAYKEGLSITEKVVGVNDPQMAMLLNNLGNLYSEQNRYAEAEPYLERSLKMLEKGKPDDNSLAPALNNLALVKKELQKYDEALMLYERSLGIMERLGGENHPMVGRVLQNLAALYERKGWKEEAQEARARAARILANRP